MRFSTKKDVLEFYGKDGKNVRALDRMLERGMVVYDRGEYITRSEWDRSYRGRGIQLKAYIGELEEKIERMVVLFYKWYKANHMDDPLTLDQFRERAWKQVDYMPRVSKKLKDTGDVFKSNIEKKEKDTSLYGEDRGSNVGVADGWKED